MYVLFTFLLIAISTSCMQTHGPNHYQIACQDDTIELSGQQWGLLTKSSRLLQNAADFYSEDHQVATLASIEATTLTSILECLSPDGTYPIDDIPRIHKMLCGASYLDLDRATIKPLIMHLKQLIEPLDITSELVSTILFSGYAWQYRKTLNSPIPIVPCIQTLKGHTDWVNALVMCGEYLASGSYDNTIKMWDPASGQCLSTLHGHKGSVRTLVMCGEYLASGSYDNTINIWDPATGQCLKTLQGHTDLVKTLVMCGKYLASGSYDNTINIWDPASGKCLNTLEGHTNWVKTLVMCGNLLASGAEDNTIKMWDPASGKCLNTLKGHTDSVQALVMCGNLLASGCCDKTIKIWDPASGQCLKTLKGHTRSVNTLVMCGNLLASGYSDKTIKIWDPASGKCLKTLKSHTGSVNTLVMCGNLLASGSDDKTIKLWDVSALDPKQYTPAQNFLIRALLKYKDNAQARAHILQDRDWQEVYNSLPTLIINELE